MIVHNRILGFAMLLTTLSSTTDVPQAVNMLFPYMDSFTDDRLNQRVKRSDLHCSCF